MQYYLCPRCKFKTAANKHVCQTCGVNFSVYNNTASGDRAAATTKVSKVKVWAKLLGLDSRHSKETGHEKPALS